MHLDPIEEASPAGAASRAGAAQPAASPAPRGPRWTTLEEAVATVPDGSIVAPGGFMLGRAPMALIFELVRQKRSHLHVISLHNPLPAEILVAAGAVSKVEFLFSGMALDGRVWPMP